MHIFDIKVGMLVRRTSDGQRSGISRGLEGKVTGIEIGNNAVTLDTTDEYGHNPEYLELVRPLTLKERYANI